MNSSLHSMARACKAAGRTLARLQPRQKQDLLLAMADGLVEATDTIVAANSRDLEAGQANGLSGAMLDRLRLDAKSIAAIAEAVRQIARQSDPVGRVRAMETMPSGIQVGRMRIPLGVIGIIYESRPNVTVDAAALCIKAGNAVMLRGGSEAFHSNQALAAVLQSALVAQGLDPATVTVLPSTDRSLVDEMLKLEGLLDVIIPRGGEGLIRHVTAHSRIPVIKHYKGVCHLYAHEDAVMDKLLPLVLNGKTQRPGVCNALETVLIHQGIANEVLPVLGKALLDKGVEIRGCERTRALLPDAKPATEADWDAEYLDLILAIRVVDGYDQALEHIERHGSQHTEVIVTESFDRAQDFLRDVDASVVMVNASSRFSDGGELGLGAEIGISTSKLHSYGPMGVEALTTEKFIVLGQGQVRG